jgi:tRNA/tmRNA/rRNA uracil-C5-methylase (TrmA/RlmC/RlmD family)
VSDAAEVSPPSWVGRMLELEVGAVAHGGHCIARHEGRVVFVRHALPGERVRARVSEGHERSRFLRADALEVLVASPERVPRPCPYAGPGHGVGGGCGGCDWQHAAPAYSRELKAAVVSEQLHRLAGLDLPVTVEPVAGDVDGLRWRSRVEFAVTPAGRAGLRRHRSHDIVELDDCLIATERVVGTGVLGRAWPGSTAVDVVAPSGGTEAVTVAVPADERSAPTVVEHVQTSSWAGDFEVGARGFWQVHVGAAATFVEHVLRELDPRPGERAIDLYCGVGLFAVALADAVGEDGAVLAVEADRGAVRDARANLAGRPVIELRQGRVDRALRPLLRQEVSADLVVLDPPRTGAGRAVVRDVAALGPRRVAYVACDPAALARDLAYAREAGYGIRSLRAFDAFPMTHHVECIAILEPVEPVREGLDG